MNHDRLDFFIERLLWYLNDRNQVEVTRNIVELAQYDLEVEDQRLEKIEDQALNDAFYDQRYGSDD